jgi:hypothetical protein
LEPHSAASCANRQVTADDDSKALAVTHTCIFDAWAAFDNVAVGVHWATSLRQPHNKRNEAAKEEAVSFAAHAALIDLFPAQAAEFDDTLRSLGYDAPGKAGRVGLTACNAVLEFRHADGSNQLGDLTPTNPAPYADYTGYAPVNTFDVLNDPNRWQPLLMPNGAPQQFLAPHWGLVSPFAITSLDSIRPEAPPFYPSREYVEETTQLLIQ